MKKPCTYDGLKSLYFVLIHWHTRVLGKTLYGSTSVKNLRSTLIEQIKPISRLSFKS